MPLHAGARLGPYEILSPLGAGGMGEVYRARDRRLNRDVAIKVLPAAFAQDLERRTRFEREVQTIGTLSHPNVVNVFDTGVEHDQLFVVMELLDGETLRERLTRGAVAVRKAIEYAVQIARGLAAAHDKGLVHRDLKPDNIFLLADGQVKVFDFGLARATTAQSGATETIAAVTDPGTVLGTAGYMAPEQVRGQAVDERADLFAFGAVLYEMLSGQRAFQRETGADTMMAILRDDPPDLAGIRAELPPALDRIVRHCLEKNPAERFQSARDVAFALTALSGSQVTSALGAASPIAARPGAARWRRAAPVIAVAMVAFAAGVLIDRQLRSTAPARIAFEAKTFTPEWITRARFGPDGRTIFYSAATTGNVPELFISRPEAMAAQPLGQPATHLLSVSSRSELAVLTGARPLHHFLFDGTLARMTIDGAPRPWLDHVREADWSPDGSTLAVIHVVDGQDQLEYPIGKVLYRFSGYLSDPRVSPDGARVAFFEHALPGDNRGDVKVASADGTVKTLAGEYSGEDGLAWSADGRRVMFSASSGGSEPYQPQSVAVDGTPSASVAFSSPGAMLVQDVSRDGRVLAIQHDRRWSVRGVLPGESNERDFSWLDFSIGGRLSPDRRSLVFTDLNASGGANYATALRDIATAKVVRLGVGASYGPSPNGRWVGSQIPSTGDITLYPVGAGQPMHLRGLLEHHTALPQWFPHSERMLVCGNEKGQQPRCYELDVKSAALKSVTPAGSVSAVIAGDERTLLVASTADEWTVLAAGQDRGVPARGLTAVDEPIGWTADGRSVTVTAGSQVPARIERVNVTTGARTFVRELAPPDRAGLIAVRLTDWIEDGAGYVYDYQRALGKLFVVTGMR